MKIHTSFLHPKNELETSSAIAYPCNKELSKGKSKKKYNKHPSEVRLSSFYDNDNSNNINLESGSIRDSKNTKIKEYESRLTKRKEVLLKRISESPPINLKLSLKIFSAR